LTTLAVDREDAVWVGSESGGAMRIAPHGLTTFDERDGLAGARPDDLPCDGLHVEEAG
jgi:hypothetical protein